MARPSETQKLISSLGVFSGRLEAVTREIGRTNSSMKLMADQQARFSTAATAEIKRAMTEAIKVGVGQAAASVVPMSPVPGFVPGSQADSGVLPAPPAPGAPPLGQHPRRASTQGVSEPGGRVEPAEEKHQYRYQDAWKNYRGYRVESLQQDVGYKVGEMLQGRESRAMSAIEAEHGFAKNTAGNWYHKASGRFASGAETEAMEGHLAQAAARYGTARRLTGAIAEGQGVKEAIGAAFPGLVSKVALPLAVAGVADQALDFATAQREQNRKWQQITGGSNASGFGERAKSQVFEWGMKGIMGAGTAEELYMGAARMGLRGDERGQALDFAVANFKKHGMDVADSLALINTALESSNSNLSGLSTALDGVSNTARAAGRNVGEAQKAFAARYETVTQTIGGASAVALAAGQTETVTNLGRGLEGITFGSSTMDQRIQAQALGMSYTDYLRDIRATGGVTAAKGQAAWSGRVATQTLGAEGQRRLAEAVERWGPATGWNTAQARIFGEELTDILPPDVAQNILQMAQVGGVTPEKAPQVIGELLSGRMGTNLIDSTSRDAGARKAYDPEALTEGDERGAGRSYVKGSALHTSSRVGQDALDDLGKRVGSRSGPMFGRHGKTQTLADARRLYIEKVTREGGKAKADPKIEELLRSGYKGKFIVQTLGEDGKPTEKAVDFETAINHYWDQLRAGTAEIGEGANRGETVASAYGVEVDKTVDVTSDDTKGKGESAEDYTKKIASDEEKKRSGGKVSGTITIEATPELKRLLHLQDHADVVYTDPNAPRNTNATPNDLSK